MMEKDKNRLIKEEYRSYNIFCYNKEFLEIGKSIIDKNYKIISELKNTKRNYVAIIEIKGKYYVYKEPRNEYRIFQRKVMSFFKKGEALRTLINTKEIEKKGVTFIVDTYLAINTRKNGMINFSCLLMEYIKEKKNDKFLELKLQKGVDRLKEIHKLGYYHGDFNPSNIILQEDNEIKLIDTQLKKRIFGEYRSHYDMITMQYDSWKEMKYPYKKNIYYYIAYGVKRFKRLTLVEKFGRFRKKMRNKLR